MSWGDAFTSAWTQATDAARSAASNVVNGAKQVGSAAVEGAKMVGSAAIEGAKWTAGKVSDGASWAIGKGKAAAGKAKDLAVGAERGLASGVMRGGDELKHEAESIGQRIGNAYDKAKKKFGLDDPKKSTSSCPPLDDKSQEEKDGCLMGYEDGKCTDVSCGKPTSADIENAKKKGYSSSKKCCDEIRAMDAASGGSPRTIFYVNGITTPQDAHCETLKAIGDATCATVVGVYNATDSFISDTLQTSEDRRLIKLAAAGKSIQTSDGRNPAVDTMRNVIVHEARTGGGEIWAHSQGGAIASLAAYDAKSGLMLGGNRNPLSGTTIRTFGSAAPQWPSGPNYDHYAHVNDYTPMTLGLGDNPSADSWRAGAGARVTRFSGNPKSPRSLKYMAGGSGVDKNLLVPGGANHSITDTYVPTLVESMPDATAEDKARKKCAQQ